MKTKYTEKDKRETAQADVIYLNIKLNSWICNLNHQLHILDLWTSRMRTHLKTNQPAAAFSIM